MAMWRCDKNGFQKKSIINKPAKKSPDSSAAVVYTWPRDTRYAMAFCEYIAPQKHFFWAAAAVS